TPLPVPPVVDNFTARRWIGIALIPGCWGLGDGRWGDGRSQESEVGDLTPRPPSPRGKGERLVAWWVHTLPAYPQHAVRSTQPPPVPRVTLPAQDSGRSTQDSRPPSPSPARPRQLRCRSCRRVRLEARERTRRW